MEKFQLSKISLRSWQVVVLTFFWLSLSAVTVLFVPDNIISSLGIGVVVFCALVLYAIPFYLYALIKNKIDIKKSYIEIDEQQNLKLTLRGKFKWAIPVKNIKLLDQKQSQVYYGRGSMSIIDNPDSFSTKGNLETVDQKFYWIPGLEDYIGFITKIKQLNPGILLGEATEDEHVQFKQIGNQNITITKKGVLKILGFVIFIILLVYSAHLIGLFGQ